MGLQSWGSKVLGVGVFGRRTGRVGGDEGQVDLGLLRGRQLALGLLGRLAQPLDRQLVARQVDALRVVCPA